MRGDGRVYKRGNKWWIAYYHRGKEHRESAGRTRSEAGKRLRGRLKEIYGGKFVGPEEERLSVDQLLDDLDAHLELREIKSLNSIRSHLKPIREHFGDIRARELTARMVEEFIRERRRQGRAPATINREIQPLKQAFNLAQRRARITRVPYIPMLKEDNARQGFFERKEFEALVKLLPDPVDDIARFAYASGWRRGEILPLRWESVDRAGQEVRIRTSKTGHGRVLPLDGPLRELVERRWIARKYVTPEGVTGLSDYVFHVEGRAITDFKKSWKTACKKAGVSGKLFHDLRRTAVRNMIRAGVPQSVAMSITGHRTISTFLRYNITSGDDVREALRRTQAHLESG